MARWFGWVCAAAMFALLALLPRDASALTISEIRLGVSAHNVDYTGGSQSDELGPSLEAEAIGKPIQALRRVGAPKPYAMASLNTHGDTSYAAAGLYWHVQLSRHWRVEPGFGVAIHNGAVHNRYADDDPRAEDYASQHQLLGSRALFRDTLNIERDVGRKTALGLTFEHLSNGGEIFGHRDNQSLNEISVHVSMLMG